MHGLEPRKRGLPLPLPQPCPDFERICLVSWVSWLHLIG